MLQASPVLVFSNQYKILEFDGLDVYLRHTLNIVFPDTN